MRNCAAEGLLCNGAGGCVEPAPATLATVGQPPAPFARSLVGAAASETRLWSVQNTGATATGTLSIASNVANSQFSVNGNCLGVALQPGASCSLNIGFAPREAGQPSETLTLNGGPGVAISIQVSGDARLPDGADCPTVTTLCDSGICTEWFADMDGDGFGSLETVGGAPVRSICGGPSEDNRPDPFILTGVCQGGDAEIPYVLRNRSPGIGNGGLDCCDRYSLCDPSGGTLVASSNAFPGQTVGSSGLLGCGTAPNAGRSRDFNCDGNQTAAPGSVDAPLSCEGRTADDCSQGGGRVTDPDCETGVLTFTGRGCTFSGGECVPSANAGQSTALCL